MEKHDTIDDRSPDGVVNEGIIVVNPAFKRNKAKPNQSKSKKEEGDWAIKLNKDDLFF